MANVPNTQITITSNGRTTLATAGKYCDRNIDIDVSVLVPPSEGGQPTQFTNLYDPANVTVGQYIHQSSGTPTYNTEATSNILKIPYNHAAGTDVVLRLRGIGTVRDRTTAITFKSDGVTKVAHYTISSSICDISYDEYGDVAITLKSSLKTTEWGYLVFTFQYPFVNKATTALTGPIVTINEPIGNGGHAG